MDKRSHPKTQQATEQTQISKREGFIPSGSTIASFISELVGCAHKLCVYMVRFGDNEIFVSITTKIRINKITQICLQLHTLQFNIPVQSNTKQL